MTPDQITMLQAKLDPAHVKSRSQSGRSLSYIEGWVAIAEANRIFGFDAWNRETVDIRCVSERERKVGSAGRDGWSVSYVARVRITVGDIVREGTGAGHGIDVDLGLAHESAIKEAETDAMKRALMTFGNPFGLALYDKTMANVGHEDDEPAPRPHIAQAPPRDIDDFVTETLLKIEAIDKASTLSIWWAENTKKWSPDWLPRERFVQIKNAYESRLGLLNGKAAA